jgi:pimeloyl-ACP methyl ester carboxylesterase
METRTKTKAKRRDAAGTGAVARERLIGLMPVAERTLDLAGIPTSVLEGGHGPPIVLLHGPGEFAAKWFPVASKLAETRRVIAPDLPGHGASGGGPVDGERVLAWLDALIEEMCDEPPAVVGQIVSGAIAARYAARYPDRVERLVLSDALGLAPFRPAARFGAALGAFLEDPDGETHDRLWQVCAHDLDGLRDRLGDRWPIFRAYNLDRARAPGVRASMQALMADFGMAGIPEEELARIEVPVTLVWGRHDLATPLHVAKAASERYGWPLRVIEGAADDPAIERPEAFVEAVREALGGAVREEER